MFTRYGQVSEKITVSLSDVKTMSQFGRAVGSETRLEILKILEFGSFNVNEIAEKLNLPVSTIASNIKVLEQVGLIIAKYQPGIRGSMKLCGRRVDEVYFNFKNSNDSTSDGITQSLPVGLFTNCYVEPSCGMASVDGFITENIPSDFFGPNRMSAQILWFSKGFVEYKFSNNTPPNKTIREIELSMEICSEAPKYRMIWPSDISIWLNGLEVAMFTSPGDFGDRIGKNNPEWWPSYNSQYGHIKYLKVNNLGSFIDEQKNSSIKIHDIPNLNSDFLDVRIGVKNDAKNSGGVNIYGEKFGDYQQDIVLKTEYS